MCLSSLHLTTFFPVSKSWSTVLTWACWGDKRCFHCSTGQTASMHEPWADAFEFVLQEADSECPSLLLGGYTYSWINLSWALEDVGSQSMDYYLPWADIPSRPRSAWPRLWEKPWEGCSRCHGEGHILKPSRQGMQQPATGWPAPDTVFSSLFYRTGSQRTALSREKIQVLFSVAL